MTKPNESAFPRSYSKFKDTEYPATSGVTKQEFIMQHVLSGIVANSFWSDDIDIDSQVIRITHELIEELNASAGYDHTKPTDPAYPRSYSESKEFDHVGYDGITFREQTAINVLRGLLSNPYKFEDLNLPRKSVQIMNKMIRIIQ